VHGQRGEVVDRAAGVAQGGGADREREVAEDREAVERAVQYRSVEQGEHPGRRDEQLVGHAVVAPGAAQAQRVPGVDDLQVVAGESDHARRGAGAGAAVLDDAAREERLGVRDPAAVGPPAGDADPAVDELGASPRGPHPGGDPLWIVEQVGPALGAEVGGEQAAGGGDRHAPAGGGVPARDRLGGRQRQARRQLEAAGLAGGAGQHDSGGAQPRHELVGEAPLPLGLRRQLAGQRGDLVRRVPDVLVERWSGMGGGWFNH